MMAAAHAPGGRHRSPSRNDDRRDKRVVIRSERAIRAADFRAPPFGQAEEQMIEPQRTERRPAIDVRHGVEAAREFHVGRVVNAEPRVEIPSDNDGLIAVED